MYGNFKSVLQLIDFFKDEDTCKQYLSFQRWGDTPACPHCGSAKAYVTNRGYKCSEKVCRKKFTVTTGTIFENSKIGLRTWFAAMYLATAHKKGISSLQLSRDLCITHAEVSLVRAAPHPGDAPEEAPQMLEGTVECDETYVGGQELHQLLEKTRLGYGEYHVFGQGGKPAVYQLENKKRLK